MRGAVFVSIICLFSSWVLADEAGEYEAAFQDGQIYAFAERIEDDIRTNYNLLIKMEAIQGAEAVEVRELLIGMINVDLRVLGWMVNDIENEGAVSKRFYDYIQKVEAKSESEFREVLGKEKASSLFEKAASETAEFWSRLKKEREVKKWNVKYPNQKARDMSEEKIELALDTLIRHGNIFKIK